MEGVIKWDVFSDETERLETMARVLDWSLELDGAWVLGG
jgi:hypothetical protein